MYYRVKVSINTNVIQQFVNYIELDKKGSIQYQTKLRRVIVKYFKQTAIVLLYIRKFKVIIYFGNTKNIGDKSNPKWQKDLIYFYKGKRGCKSL